MNRPKSSVGVFLYGSYMSLDVLAGADVVPDSVGVSCLPGFDIEIGSLANLVESSQHSVFGTLVRLSQEDVERLYSPAQSVLGGTRYYPRAVLVVHSTGGYEPAPCYLARETPSGGPQEPYVQRVLAAARSFEFPDWNLRRLESFLPS